MAFQCSCVFFLPAAIIIILPLILPAVISQPMITLQHAAGQLPVPTSDDRQAITHSAAGDHGDHHDDHTGYDDDGGDDIPRLYIVQLLPPQQHGRGPVLQSGGGGGDDADDQEEEVEAWYRSFLPTTHLLDSGKPRLVHSYRKAICGFAAWLTPREVEAMRGMEGFVGAQLDGPLKLLTTHTPKFLGLENGTGLWRQTKWGGGRLIGVVDSGIDPDHVSFAGTGMESPPEWKGTCDFNCKAPFPFNNCVCTNKLLGAVSIDRGSTPSKIERDEHGTMCASIAAGDFVGDVADATGYARGTASGASPKSYLSFYAGTQIADTVAAIDRAIGDGVNVLSISQGPLFPSYPSDVLAIATLAAVERGIFVAMAAGNSGPGMGTIENHAPWQLAVGASTHGRAAEMELVVIESTTVEYPSFYGVTQCRLKQFSELDWPLPLMYPGYGPGNGRRAIRTCNHTLGGEDATGAMVLCWRDPAVPPFDQAQTVKDARGKAMVLMNDGTWGDDLSVVPYLHLPTIVVKHSDSNMIIQTYVNSKKNMRDVMARVRPVGSRFHTRLTPVIADFSARGPNPVTKSILKPDILGPGVNVLAAKAGTKDEFFTESGTSLATPHLAGIAAMLKSRHPGWSPAVIRSAIMTTAITRDTDGNLITDHYGNAAGLYAAGAGLVNPHRADDPGLVYDITDTTDYLRILCRLYPQEKVNRFARMGRIVDCAALGTLEPEELNYPSITMTLERMGKKVVYRTVTNVGPAASLYECSVEGVPTTEVRVSVTPCRLAFTRRRAQLGFAVEAERVPATGLPSGKVIEGYLKWTSVQLEDRRVVRSPLVLIVP